MSVLSELWENVRGLHNVTGYSKKLRDRVRDGKTIEEEVFRVYVSRKLPLEWISLQHRIPAEIEEIPTDVWNIGEMVIPPLMAVNPLAITHRERPLKAGIGIGNEAITVGTLGWFFEKNGEIGIGSNAHIIAEDALHKGSVEKDILQPGTYDGGRDPEDTVAKYRWHQQLYGGESFCPVAQGLAWMGNALSLLAMRRTRFKLFAEGLNKVDFGVTEEPSVEYALEIHGAKEWSGFVGLGFAGSDQASFFCKAENIVETGWKPVDVDIHEVDLGDTLHKVGRTTEYTKGTVLDDCVHGTVNYGGFNYIEFDDLLMTEAMLEGGDSGSSIWKYTSE